MKIQLIRSNAFLPMAIQTVQYIDWLWDNAERFLKGKKLVPLFAQDNHVSIIIDKAEYEALAHGVEKSWYSVKGHHHVNEWDIPTTKEKEVRKYLEDQIDKGYEYDNFFWHLLKVPFNKWFGAYNDKRHSCVELATRALQIAGVEGIDKYDSPYDLKRKLIEKFGQPTVTKQYRRGFVNHLLYWATPAIKLAATILVLYLAFKGILFMDIHVTNYF
jgi:hypothetical protein